MNIAATIRRARHSRLGVLYVLVAAPWCSGTGHPPGYVALYGAVLIVVYFGAWILATAITEGGEGRT